MSNKKARRRLYEEKTKERHENLRGELKKLRKEVLQLRKENAKLRGRDVELKDFFEEMESEKELEVKIDESCPQCGSKNIKIIEKLQGGKDYYFCQNESCKARGIK